MQYRNFIVRLDSSGKLACDELDIEADSFAELKKLIDKHLKAKSDAHRRTVLYIDSGGWPDYEEEIVEATLGAKHSLRGMHWVSWKEDGQSRRGTKRTISLYENTPEIRALLEEYVAKGREIKRIQEERDEFFRTIPAIAEAEE